MTKGKQIKQMIQDGKSNEEILAEVDTTINSVRWYRSKSDKVDSQIAKVKKEHNVTDFVPRSASKHPYTIKKFQTMRTTDWPAFSFDLWEGKICHGMVSDDGMGGMIHYMNLPKKVIKNLEKIYDDDIESAIYKMVDEFENTKRLKRLLKGKVLYITNGLCYEIKHNGKVESAIQYVKNKYRNCTILNGMDFEEAFKLYIEATK